MRDEAVIGRVFYENRLTDKEWVKTFFPPTQKEENYDRRPKVSVPIVGEVVDRIASLVYSGMSIEFDNERDERDWDEIAERNRFADRARGMLVNPMARACEVTILHNIGGSVFWQAWGGEFAYYMRSPFYEAAGYEYVEKEDGTLRPVLNKHDVKDKNYHAVVIDSSLFIETFGENVSATIHGLEFAPFIFSRSVDVDQDGRYSHPFSKRADDLIVTYCQTLSQAVKSTNLMQNIWETNKEADNPNFPLRLDPDTINHVGPDGFLRQVVRNLELGPEMEIMSRLKQHISTRFQVPDFMTGLSDVGKVESGLALQIVSGPLTELVDRIRPAFKKNIEELVWKSLAIQTQARGSRPGDVKFTVNMSESILPSNVQTEIDTLIKAMAAGIVGPQYTESLQAKVAALLELTESTATPQ
jgi:hypothetical protein